MFSAIKTSNFTTENFSNGNTHYFGRRRSNVLVVDTPGDDEDAERVSVWAVLVGSDCAAVFEEFADISDCFQDKRLEARAAKVSS